MAGPEADNDLPTAGITVAPPEADNDLPTAGTIDAASDEDGLRISELTPSTATTTGVAATIRPKFAFVEGVLSYDFGNDGPAGTDPFVWSLDGLAAKGVSSEGYTLLYEVVDGVTLNAYYMGVPEYPDYPEYPGEGDGPSIAAIEQPELPPVKILVFSLTVTDWTPAPSALNCTGPLIIPTRVPKMTSSTTSPSP